jgi:hypothetical protein
MSYQSQLLVPCPDLQAEIFSVWQASNDRRDPIPFLEYITSPDNRNGIDMQVAPGEGKVRTVNLTYTQRLPESSVTEATERGCDVGEVKGNCSKDYTIDTTDLIQSTERITAQHLARACKNNGQYISERLLAHLNVIDRKVSSQIGAEAALLKGAYSADAVAAYSITNDVLEVATKASGAYAIGAHVEIEQVTQMTGFNSALMFGGSALNEYMKLTMAGCCANVGLDVQEIYNLYGYSFAYDRRLATALGNGINNNLVMEPQALQLLHYQETEWLSNSPIDMNSGYASFPLTTPAGVPVDVYIKDNCAGKIDINVFANVKLVGLPEDLFPTGDNFEGVTYVGQVNVNNS